MTNEEKKHHEILKKFRIKANKLINKGYEIYSMLPGEGNCQSFEGECRLTDMNINDGYNSITMYITNNKEMARLVFVKKNENNKKDD